uniref:Adaptor protein, phosphotyrosine interacting with PH domain and leucine zipper 2 n=1 Tax=Lynx canadensis TaxID=61383 RepID=A0A667G961_LYNCA
MPAVDKLLLEEALQDSPQTRSLLSVFEEDAGTLTDYTNQLLQAMQRVYGAQNEMCLATQQLSKQLLAYEKQNFALGKGDEEVISTLHYFSKVVDELNVLHTELAKQLADTMVLPIIQFREKDLTEVSTLKDLFGLASNEHDLSMAKYSRLPKKKENEKVKIDVVKEVAAARRKQHLSSLQYYCALNALQYRKRVAMMEPMIGFAHGQSRNGRGCREAECREKKSRQLFITPHVCWGAWVAQSVKRPTSPQDMMSRFVSLSPASGSVLSAQSLEPASDSVSSSFCPSPTCALSLSLKNK